MFDFGGGEIIIIAIVALIAIGPKELPGMLRMVGQWVGKARSMARDFQNQFQDALREAEIADMKKEFDEAADKANLMVSNSTGSVKDALSLDPPAEPTEIPPQADRTEVADAKGESGAALDEGQAKPS